MLKVVRDRVCVDLYSSILRTVRTRWTFRSKAKVTDGIRVGGSECAIFTLLPNFC